ATTARRKRTSAVWLWLCGPRPDGYRSTSDFSRLLLATHGSASARFVRRAMHRCMARMRRFVACDASPRTPCLMLMMHRFLKHFGTSEWTLLALRLAVGFGF